MAAGKIPTVIALNKSDLADKWQLSAADEAALMAHGMVFKTSAKSGERVETMFTAIGRALLATGKERT